ERVGEIEVDHLPLARFADQRLTGERGAAHEHAERGFDRAPQLDQISGKVFRVAAGVEPGRSGARRIECRARPSLSRGAHRTIRRSPATALPRMKLSASWVGMRTPVRRNPSRDTPFMYSCMECDG